MKLDVNSIESLLDYTGRCHTIIDDKAEVLAFYHEYACLTCEYQGIDPHKAVKYIHQLMLERMRVMALAARKNYESNPLGYIRLNQLLSTLEPSSLVRQELKSGRMLVSNKKYSTLDDWLKDHPNKK
jgi:hypothetical protein